MYAFKVVKTVSVVTMVMASTSEEALQKVVDVDMLISETEGKGISAEQIPDILSIDVYAHPMVVEEVPYEPPTHH